MRKKKKTKPLETYKFEFIPAKLIFLSELRKLCKKYQADICIINGMLRITIGDSSFEVATFSAFTDCVRERIQIKIQ